MILIIRFELAKKMLGENNTTDETMMAAFGAGSFCTLVTNPMSVVRSRMLLTDQKEPKKYISIFSAMKHIIKFEGFGGLYKVLFLDFFLNTIYLDTRSSNMHLDGGFVVGQVLGIVL